MATIRIVDVSKVFGRATAPRRQSLSEDVVDDRHNAALDHIYLTVPHGVTMAVVGPSGSGKSTLLRVVAGLEGDYTGELFYDDQEMRTIPPKERHIGMVFQNYALYPHFPGHGNLAFFFRLRKISDQETEERIRITSEIMGIGFRELLHRRPGTLSGGQQQRLAIGRAIVRNPRLFLFDEPLSNLDAKLRMQTRVEIKRLLHRFQITALYVTHDQSEAIALGDQIAVMRAGRVEQAGPVGTLLAEPANAFVAGFLGTPPMNLLTGGVVAEEALALDGVRLPLPPAIRRQVVTGQALTLGVRPEAARLVDEAAGNPVDVRVRGTVEVIEPDHARRTQWLHLRRGSLTLTVSAPLTQPIYVGNTVDVSLPAEQLYFFDGTDERRIG
jgi:ABC-type sugar transport system ATPase subunit